MEGAERDCAGCRLARGDAGLGHLDAVVGRVADHVDERVAQFLDDVAVELGVFPFEREEDLLPLLEGEIADEPRHLLEGVADRHHPQRHRRPLEIGGDAAELAETAGEMGAGDRLELGILHDHRLRDDQLTDEIDEAVELDGVDADDARPDDRRRGLLTGGLFLRHRRGNDGRWRCHGRFAAGGLGFAGRSGGGKNGGKIGFNGGRDRRWRRRSRGSNWSVRSGRRVERGRHRLHGCRREGSWSRRTSGEEGVNIMDQLRDRQVDRSPGFDPGDLVGELGHEPLEDIGAGENDRDRIASKLVLPTPSGIEHRFQLMGELLENEELHHPDVPLERVERPEERVEGGGVGRIDLQDEHPLLDVLEEILGFGAEQLKHLQIGIRRDDIDRLLGKKLHGQCCRPRYGACL